MRHRTAVLALSLVLSGGCTSGAAQRTDTITVLAAASLTEAFAALGKDFEQSHHGTRIRFSFASSPLLAQQAVNGAPADVFASASTKSMDTVVAAGEVDGPTAFASNSAEIAVRPGGEVRSLADLARPGVRVALCQPDVPCGALAKKVLANAGVTVHPVTLGLDVKQVLALVARGEVDAGIVYVTDITAAKAEVKGVPIPPAVNASTSYPIAVLKGSRHEQIAAAFVAYVLSPAGQAVLRSAGFAAP